MLVTIFTLSTLAGLFFLFRKRTVFPGDTSRKVETWKLVLSGVGALLIAIPGAISLATLCPAPSPAVSALDGQSITLPAGEPVGLLAAGAFVVRGFVTAEATGEKPVDFFSTVIAIGAGAEFSLKDDSSLKIKLIPTLDEGPTEKVTIGINCQWKTAGSERDCRGLINAPSPAEFEPGHRAFEKTFVIPGSDTTAFASLFTRRGEERTVRLLLTPVAEERSFTTRPGREWRKEQGETITALLSSPPPTLAGHWTGRGTSSHDFVAFGMSGWALLFLAAGALLILISSTSRLRTLCLLVLYLCLYTGTIDSCVLRCQSARLDSSDPAVVRAAAIGVSSTHLHPTTAALHLLDRARSEPDPVLRRHLLLCLDKPTLLQALCTTEGASDTLSLIAEEGEGESALIAKRLGRALERYSLTRESQPEND
jgi:hypothetical protein